MTTPIIKPRKRFVDDLNAWARFRDGGLYPNFKPAEFNCRCDKCKGETGAENMTREALDAIQRLRDDCGFALEPTSGYRCAAHPREAAKAKPGAHNRGVAIDIRVFCDQALTALAYALRDTAPAPLIEDTLNDSFRRIGIAQKGAFSGRFIHLQILDQTQSTFTLFSY